MEMTQAGRMSHLAFLDLLATVSPGINITMGRRVLRHLL